MRTRPLLLLAAAAAAAALVLSGCTSSGSDTKKTDAPKNDSGITVPADIADRGYLNVAAYFNYPPYTIPDGDKLTGVEADLITAVAKRLGLEVKFHDYAFESLIPAVSNGRADLLIGPMADTPERHKEVTIIDFASTLWQAIVKKGNPTGFDVTQPCGAKGGEVSASNNLQGSQKLSDDCVAAGKPKISLLSLPDNGGVFQSIITGRTDFSLQVPAVAKYMVDTTPDLELQGEPFKIDGIGEYEGWIVAKDNDELTSAIVQAINSMIADGSWQKLMADAGREATSLPEPLVNGEPYTAK